MGAEPKLAQCPRCQNYTLVATREAFTVAVDVAPLDRQGFANAVVSGVGLWAVVKGPGGASRMRTHPPGTPGLSFDPGGRQNGTQGFVHAEHSCGASARDQRIVPKVTRQGPPQASATSGGHKGGSRPLAARAGASRDQERPSPAAPASPHLSDHGTETPWNAAAPGARPTSPGVWPAPGTAPRSAPSTSTGRGPDRNAAGYASASATAGPAASAASPYPPTGRVATRPASTTSTREPGAAPTTTATSSSPTSGATPSRATARHGGRSRPPVCCICDKVIAVGLAYYAVECPPGIYAWALHEECP